MGEVDTKPIESVQAAISLFGEIGDQRKHLSDAETNKEELDFLQKELASYKVQLEAKESAYMQALLKLQHYNERTEELSSQLMKSELERDISIGKLREARFRMDELESKFKETTDDLSETTDAHKQLLNELRAMQAEQLSMEAGIAAECESKNRAMKRAEEMELMLDVEKEKVEALLKHVDELDESIHVLKVAALEAEKEKNRILLEKDVKLELATATAVKMQEELDCMEKQLYLIHELETHLLAKSITIESLQSDLRESNETINALKEDVAHAMKNVEELRGELKVKEREISDRAVYIEMLEVELNQLKEEVTKLNEKCNYWSHEMRKVRKEHQNAEIELTEFKDQETQAQVEIATLKAELHKARLRLVAAEAAEVRAEGVRSGLYLAVQQLAAEAEEVKNENQRLKQAVETERANSFEEKPTSDGEASEYASGEAFEEENGEEEEARITIPLEEYEALITKAKKADEIPVLPVENANEHKMESLKRELEVATVKIGEFRTRVEQAVTRAEAAEKARAALEEQLRRWRERKQRRKAALAALREESASRESPTPSHVETPVPHTPLGKVLNLNF